jgi:hypothetical protein
MASKDSPSWIKYSLAKMKMAGLEQMTSTQLLTIVSWLMIWMNVCWRVSSKKNRAEYVLGVLGGKQKELALAVVTAKERVERPSGVDESHVRLFPDISDAESGRLIRLMETEDAFRRELSLIGKAMEQVSKLLENGEAMEPSPEADAADYAE